MATNEATTKRRALISVSDKAGVLDFARDLAAAGWELLSTGGTLQALTAAGIPATSVVDVTGFPEIMDGRVKTLHPNIHGGILARRDAANAGAHLAELAAHSITPIDLVCVNLYPFRETVEKGADFESVIENIDVGGPAMIRAAAKNHASVLVLVDPTDYGLALQPSVSLPDRQRLAAKAFAHTAAYDAAIAAHLNESAELPAQLTLELNQLKGVELRYGENPHQPGAVYRVGSQQGPVLDAQVLSGKPMSFNNYGDTDAAWALVQEFPVHTAACVCVKHANPCGVALGASAAEAYGKAFKTDPTSAFGGIIAFNCELDGAGAALVAKQFVEVLMAPSFTPEALVLLTAKPNTRVLQIALPAGGETDWDRGRNAQDMKRVGSGLLIQTADNREIASTELKIVTDKQPTAEQLGDLLFAWKVAKYVKSNAIVFCGGGMTLGVGAGQMSRIDSARIASIKAGNAGLTLVGSAVASDAFFPFRDGLDVVIDQGATSVIQPGGSMRDDEVIAAANERGIVMVTTGVRHFRH